MNRINGILFFIISIGFLEGCNFEVDDNKSQLLKKNIDNMVFVKGGMFYMGDIGTKVVSDSGESQHLPWSRYLDDDYLHKVVLSSFWMNKYETTYGDFDKYTELTGQERQFENIKKRKKRGKNYPVGVSWYQANDYCQWLAKESGLAFSLPTEAQWEYAARNRGKPIGYATNDGTIKPGVNYHGRDENLRGKVGRYPPNPLGLHDMSDNVFEWVFDWYDKDYYKNSTVNNPTGPDKGTEKVVRFGNQEVTLYGRIGRAPSLKLYEHGVRCVVNAETLNN